ncbi:MAG: DNA polymerase III subunit delta [Phycisphaerales bacterium]|nr:DNA polymerase III subunit delta [Phycisphaerales bacterium]
MAKRQSSSSKAPSRAPNADDRVVVLAGKELFLRQQYTSMLRAALEQVHGEIETFKFAGESVQIAEVLDECRSFGLMSTHKLVIVDDADALVVEATRPMLERYAEDPCEQATLLLRASTWRPGNLDKAIAKVGVVTKCDQIEAPMALKWTMARAQRAYESSIGQREAAMLVERLGVDLGKIDAELGKLAIAAGAGSPISQELIMEMVPLTREVDNPWVIQEPLLSGDPEYTLRQLRIVLENSGKSNAVPVSYACMDLARKLVGVTEGAASGQNLNTVAKELKLWGESRDAIMRLSKRVKPSVARELLDASVRADMDIKRSADPVRTLEVLALRFAAVVR